VLGLRLKFYVIRRRGERNGLGIVSSYILVRKLSWKKRCSSELLVSLRLSGSLVRHFLIVGC
jgi:hypothetical protein